MRDFLTAMLPCAVSMTLITLVYAAFMPLLSKRCAAKWLYRAWMLIAAGWVFPFRPRIELPFLPLKSASIAGTPAWTVASAIPSMAGAGDIVEDIAAAISLWTILAAIWILGVIIAAAYHTLRHRRFMKAARRWSDPITDPESLRLLDGLKSEIGIKVKVDLNVCQSVTSPLLAGFLRPVVLLPPGGITGDELYFILKHELIHFQRRDLWGKALILTATALHWFNPTVYLMAKAAAAQCEISCDALTLQDADINRRKQYGETIIGVIRNGTRLRTALSTNLYGGKNGMKNRIFAIMDTKRKNVGAAIFCVVLASVIIIGTAVAASSTDTRPVDATDSDVMITVTTDTVQGVQRQVSVDSGKTWMDEEAYRKQYPPSDSDYSYSNLLADVEWWTNEEYSAFVDGQKTILPDLIGETGGYYDEKGVLHEEIWTLEKVDEAISLYEQTLEDIRNGVKVSKPVIDGGTMIGYSYSLNHNLNPSDPPSIGYSAGISLENGDTVNLGSFATEEERLAAVKSFCDEQVKTGNMTQQEADGFLSQYK
jgi:beta-lactamase regulating signal transducer with metallopeptidase domain